MCRAIYRVHDTQCTTAGLHFVRDKNIVVWVKSEMFIFLTKRVKWHVPHLPLGYRKRLNGSREGSLSKLLKICDLIPACCKFCDALVHRDILAVHDNVSIAVQCHRHTIVNTLTIPTTMTSQHFCRRPVSRHAPYSPDLVVISMNDRHRCCSLHCDRLPFDYWNCVLYGRSVQYCADADYDVDDVHADDVDGFAVAKCVDDPVWKRLALSSILNSAKWRMEKMQKTVKNEFIASLGIVIWFQTVKCVGRYWYFNPHIRMADGIIWRCVDVDVDAYSNSIFQIIYTESLRLIHSFNQRRRQDFDFWLQRAENKCKWCSACCTKSILLSLSLSCRTSNVWNRSLEIIIPLNIEMMKKRETFRRIILTEFKLNRTWYHRFSDKIFFRRKSNPFLIALFTFSLFWRHTHRRTSIRQSKANKEFSI